MNHVPCPWPSHNPSVSIVTLNLNTASEVLRSSNSAIVGFSTCQSDYVGTSHSKRWRHQQHWTALSGGVLGYLFSSKLRPMMRLSVSHAGLKPTWKSQLPEPEWRTECILWKRVQWADMLHLESYKYHEALHQNCQFKINMDIFINYEHVLYSRGQK